MRASLSIVRTSEELQGAAAECRTGFASPSAVQADAGGWAFQSRRRAGERQRRRAREISREGSSGCLRESITSRSRDISFYAAMGDLGARHSSTTARDCARVSSTRSSQEKRAALLDRRRSISMDACAPVPADEFSNAELMHRVTLFVGS